MFKNILNEVGHQLKKKVKHEVVVFFIDEDKNRVFESYKQKQQCFSINKYKKRSRNLLQQGFLIVESKIPRPYMKDD